jgi:choline dehydrogenase-like flavoprotein
MIVDAAATALPETIRADLVIVGAGAAGITLALALADSRLDIVIVAAGGDRFDPVQQDFYRAASVSPASHGQVDMFRRRVLGGSTAVWGGRCIPFDPIDFEDRPWLGSYARWPIGHDDVARYYHPALETARAGAPEFTASEAMPGEPADLAPGIDSPDVILDRIERFSEPTDFGKVYRQRLANAPRIRLFTHAAVSHIETRDGGAHVAGVRLRLSGGRGVRIDADRVVLAAGGIETARLLLASDDARPTGLGNEHDLVGRFYQCHIEGELGEIAFTAPREQLRIDYQRSRDGIYCRRYIWLSPEAQRARRLAGLVLRPAHANIVDPAHRHPVLSAMFLVKDRIVPEYARKMTALEHEARRAHGGGNAAFYGAHLRNLVAGAPALAHFSADWLRRRVLAKRKLPSVVLEDRRGVYPIDINAEQAPNPHSRITLSHERDAAGLRRIAIDWRIEEEDSVRVLEGIRTIQAALAGSGTVQIALSPEAVERWTANRIPVGGHHIGTARMGATPQSGVCDANCELFGTRGLFIAGAAAFPTSGFANPTLTLLALTLRLADHLAATARG